MAVGAYLLHHLEGVFIHDRWMGVPEQLAFLLCSLDALFTAVVFGCGLEVLRMTQVLRSVQDPGYSFLCPAKGLIREQFTPLLRPIRCGGKYLLFLQPVGDLCRAKAITAQLVDVPNRFSSFLVNQPFVLVVLILDIAERGICSEVFAAVALHFERGFDFLGGISGVKFVTKIADRRHIKLGLHCRVHVVIDGDEPHIVFYKYDVRIHPHLQIVPAQAGHILDNDRPHLAGLDHLLHPAKTWSIESCTGITVIHKILQIFEAIFSGILLKQFLLVDNTIALTFPPIVLGQAAVEGCDPVFIRLPVHGISFPTIGYGVLRKYHTISQSIIQRFNV